MAPQIFFLHIPKTAGTSLKRYLDQSAGAGNVFWPGRGGRTFEDLTRAEIHQYPVIGGHIPFHFAHWGFTDRKNTLPRLHRALDRPRRIYASVVRDPADALISHFNYVNNTPTHGWQTKGDFETALTNGEKFFRKSRDLQCWYLSGRRNARAALANIRRHPFIVGTFERLDLFTEALGEILGTEARLPHLNVTPKRHVEDLSPEVRARIAALTAQDQQLFDEIKAEGLFVNR